MNDKIKLGKQGERFTVKYLKRHRYKIILRNFSTYDGEIDIIAKNKEFIVFVEVKTRAEDALLPTRMSVTSKKQNKIIKCANQFLRRYKTDLKPRFDISEITYSKNGKLNIDYIEAAY